MADRVPKIRDADKPTTDAKALSDRLQETRTRSRDVAGAEALGLPAVPVFDKTSPSSIVSLATYVRGKLTDTVNALSEFTAGHEVRLLELNSRLNAQNARLEVLEASRVPFGSGSG